MITVYTKPNCVSCSFTKKFFEENNIEHSVVDITQDSVALDMIKLHGYQGVPVVAINGFDNSWSGFRPDRLEELVSDGHTGG